jgi:hypothetical protein
MRACGARYPRPDRKFTSPIRTTSRWPLSHKTTPNTVVCGRGQRRHRAGGRYQVEPGPTLEPPPGRYKYSIRSASRRVQNEELKVHNLSPSVSPSRPRCTRLAKPRHCTIAPPLRTSSVTPRLRQPGEYSQAGDQRSFPVFFCCLKECWLSDFSRGRRVAHSKCETQSFAACRWAPPAPVFGRAKKREAVRLG